MKSEEQIYRVASISELHSIVGFEKPKHPLITVIDYSKVNVANAPETGRIICEFYSVNFKSHCSFRYGRQFFDHQEGTLLCTAPEQIITMEQADRVNDVEGWGLFFHPEFIRHTALGKKMAEYTFFRYEENEALHLSFDEKNTLTAILKQIEKEYQTNIDKHSQVLLLSNLELLLNYCMRFYGRQFLTRTSQNKDIVAKFEQFLTEYIHSEKLKYSGIPTVKYCAEKLNLSANYFSDLLKSETGKTAQEHIHYHLRDRAKTLLQSTDKTVNEIAYEFQQTVQKEGRAFAYGLQKHGYQKLNKMAINIKRVLISGFIAGIIISLSAVTMVPVVGNEMDNVLASRGLSPLSNTAMVYFCCISLVFGISLIFLYAILRPQFGSRIKTVIIASIIVWVLGCVNA